MRICLAQPWLHMLWPWMPWTVLGYVSGNAQIEAKVVVKPTLICWGVSLTVFAELQ